MQGIGSGKPGPGRPKGSKNELTVALREMILNSLDRVGGESYLMKLAVENSSAYASLLGKVLPSTIQAADFNGGPAVIEFQRVIVMPDGTGISRAKHPSRSKPKLPIRFPETSRMSATLTFTRRRVDHLFSNQQVRSRTCVKRGAMGPIDGGHAFEKNVTRLVFAHVPTEMRIPISWKIEIERWA